MKSRRRLKCEIARLSSWARSIRRQIVQDPNEGKIDGWHMRALDLEVQVCERVFQLGRRAEANQRLDALERRLERSYGSYYFEMARFSWLAVERPKAWRSSAALRAEGSYEDLQFLSLFALNLREYPNIARPRRQATQLVLDATKWKDAALLRFAVSTYIDLGDDVTALAATEALIRGYPDSYYWDMPEIWEEYVENWREIKMRIAAQRGRDARATIGG